jgi:hypothetical protein
MGCVAEVSEKHAASIFITPLHDNGSSMSLYNASSTVRFHAMLTVKNNIKHNAVKLKALVYAGSVRGLLLMLLKESFLSLAKLSI